MISLGSLVADISWLCLHTSPPLSPNYADRSCQAGRFIHGDYHHICAWRGSDFTDWTNIRHIAGGIFGKRYTKKYLLSAIYAGRTVIAAWFIMTPMTPTTVLIFSAAMGSLWLATVPLTSGLIAHIYGLRYMGTLYEIVFFSHNWAALQVSGWAARCMMCMAITHWFGGWR